MPLFTGTPVKVGANPPTTWQGSANSGAGARFVGPFEVGSDLYIVQSDVDTFNLEVYKSTDNGATWTEKDSANEPTVDAGNYYVDLSGTTLRLIYSHSISFFATYREFNTATDMWGSADVSTGPDALQGAFRVALCPNGDHVCLAIVSGNIISQRRASGSWNASILLATPDPANADTGTIRSVVSDSSSTVHFIYDIAKLFNPNRFFDLYYRSLTSADVVSSKVQLATQSTASNYGTGSPGAIFQGAVTIPSSNLNATLYPTDLYGPPGVWQGVSPYGVSDWTFLPVDASLSARQTALVILDSTHALLLWVDRTFASPLSLWLATFDGTTFGTPVEVYNSTSDPPPAGSGSLYQPSMAVLASGAYGIVLTGGPDSFGSGIYFSFSFGGSSYRNKFY